MLATGGTVTVREGGADCVAAGWSPTEGIINERGCGLPSEATDEDAGVDFGVCAGATLPPLALLWTGSWLRIGTVCSGRPLKPGMRSTVGEAGAEFGVCAGAALELLALLWTGSWLRIGTVCSGRPLKVGMRSFTAWLERGIGSAVFAVGAAGMADLPLIAV